MAFAELGKLIFEGRKRQGWDQAEVAMRLGGAVGQQTVSRWERGASRPRRNVLAQLAVILDLDAQHLLDAAGYGPLADKPTAEAPRPVRPLLTVLPLAALSPEQFEQFVTDIANRLYPEAAVSRLGSQGHKQHGVDIVVKVGGGYAAAFQCKRHKEFGAAKVREAVAKVTLHAERHHLVLSRPSASSDARREIEKYPHWILWDAEDLCRILRTELTREDAVRIVDTYFSSHLADFFGLEDSGPWLKMDEFFRGFGKLYRQDWDLVGRDEQIAAINSFLDTGDSPLSLLIGRGGIGKTRVLREVAREAEARGFAVRFLKLGTDLEPKHFGLLPPGDRLLLIIDDAHDREDVLSDLGDLLRHRRPVKLLLALRPYGLDLLRSVLPRLGLRPAEVPSWALNDLSKADARGLARQALGRAVPEHIADRLGAITADCPFITVIAGVLIRRGDLDPTCVDHEDTIREEALGKFRDVIVADPSADDPVLRAAVLDAVAILQPFRSDDSQFRETMTALTDVPYDRVVRQLRGLEDAGVLMRRGGSLRVVPDLLGDLILTRACFDEKARISTGYVERVWPAVSGEVAQHVFVNITRVDWQIQHDVAGAPSLTSLLWDRVVQSIKEAGIGGRLELLKLIAKVAFFEPQRSLEVVRWVLDNPSDQVEEHAHPLLRHYELSYDMVLHESAPILQAISFNLEHLPEAADLLWRLATNDHRATNPFPERPLRVLQSLAELIPGRPAEYYEAVVDAVEQWLQELPADYAGPSPFDVLEPILATEGTTSIVDGFQLQLRAAAVNPAAVRPLRDRVIGLALKELRASDVRRGVRAAAFIESALRYPFGVLNRQPTDEERQAWTDHFLNLLQRLQQAVADPGLDPIVVVAIRRALFWHSGYSETPTQAAAQQVLADLPDSLENRLAVGLFDGWGQLLRGKAVDHRDVELHRTARTAALADELLAQYPDTELVDLLVDRLDQQERAYAGQHGAGFAGPFVWTLVTARPPLGLIICERIAVRPDGPLLGVLAVVLAALAESLPNDAIPAATRLLQIESLPVTRGVAQALGWNRVQRTVLEGELTLLRSLASHDDVSVRNSIITAAHRLANAHPAEAIGLISQVPFFDSTVVAEELLQSFTGAGPFRWEQLTEAAADQLLGHLVQCPAIDGYWATQFLAERSGDDPSRIVHLLMKRIEYWEAVDSVLDYRALPFEWHHPLQVRAAGDPSTLLKELRDWMAARHDSWRRLDEGGRLYAAIALNYDNVALGPLEEIFELGDRAQFDAAAAILRRAPQNFVFERPDFVRWALRAANKHGQEVLQTIGGALEGATISGPRMGTPGQPLPRDVEIETRALEIADRSRRGSIEERFYRSLQKFGHQSVRWTTERDEKLIDGRDW